MNTADILVIDDDPAICQIVQRMLSDEQYKVQTKQSVADAFGAIEQKAFDAYLIDFKLPDGSGLDVAEKIRSKWGASPIVLMAGYDPSAVALRAEKLGISEFLEKPFSRKLIREAVKKAIGSPEAFYRSVLLQRTASSPRYLATGMDVSQQWVASSSVRMFAMQLTLGLVSLVGTIWAIFVWTRAGL
jgi:DNA-binding NtrC family response regulator